MACGEESPLLSLATRRPVCDSSVQIISKPACTEHLRAFAYQSERLLAAGASGIVVCCCAGGGAFAAGRMACGRKGAGSLLASPRRRTCTCAVQR